MTTEKMVLYTFPTIPDAKEHRVLRLTIGIVTALGMARYRRLIREASLWIDERFGKEDSDAPEAEVSVERAELQDVIYHRAYMLASLKTVEEGTCAADAKMPTEWKHTELPKEWQTIEGFMNDLDGKLFAEWDNIALMCNPETFFVSMDEKKRMPGSVIVI